eukprot:TRINITY_DN9744_c0_g1_i2.p1 TRINITY_DN9744_c0_g1~~TRINITY_DN9744_c0_g1_i2.p1  ORF type:complete len:189 (+),score=30.64 TRINITY_DN9744_c0_g1_i2:191-757(+)
MHVRDQTRRWRVTVTFAVFALLFLEVRAATVDPCANTSVWPTLSQWVPVYQNGNGISDVYTDGKVNGREYVGNTTFPALYWANTGTQFYVRARLDSSPINGQSLGVYNWGLLFDTDGKFDKYDYVLWIDASGGGGNDWVRFSNNTVPKGFGDPSDPAEARPVHTMSVSLSPTRLSWTLPTTSWTGQST